jgi:hypothetical protein
MRIRTGIFLFCLLFLGCREASTPASYIHSIMDTVSIDRSKNILIYTLNPNDCISCINGFKELNERLSDSDIPLLYAVSVEREIEKNELLKNIKDVDLHNNKNKVVLWSKNIFDGINKSVHKGGPLSLMTIYNYNSDSVLYSKPIREISNEAELRKYLGK